MLNPEHAAPAEGLDEASSATTFERLGTGLTTEWYLRQIDADTRTALGQGGPLSEEAFKHYVEVGSSAGLSPAPTFSPAFYRARHGEMIGKGEEPLLHYAADGREAGAQPHPLLKPGASLRLVAGMSEDAAPLFDTAFYLEDNPDVAATGIDPVYHYFRWGMAEGRSPVRLFDPAFYLSQVGGLHHPVDPLVHYVTEGWRAGLAPHSRFDRERFDAEHPDWEDGPLSPIEQIAAEDAASWLVPDAQEPAATAEAAEGAVQLAPEPEEDDEDVSAYAWLGDFFDDQFYREQLKANGIDPSGMGPRKLLDHYFSKGHAEGFRPFRLFSPAHYLRTNSDVAKDGIEPLKHWVLHGRAEGRSPHPLVLKSPLVNGKPLPFERDRPHPDLIHPIFSVPHYVDAAGAEAEVSPLFHYLERGHKQGLSPNPLFDPEFYVAQIEVETVEAPLLHFVETGAAEGKAPSAIFDPVFYAAAAGVTPDLAIPTFLRSKQRISPHPLLDIAYYLDKAKLFPHLSDRAVVRHFLEKGAEAGIPFHPLFDIEHYEEQRSRELWEGGSAFHDYLSVGWKEGASPHPLFDPAHYAKSVGIEDVNPFVHYLSSKERAGGEVNYLLREVGDGTGFPALKQWVWGSLPSRPSAYTPFDRAFYMAQLADRKLVLAPGEDPMAHYLTKGFTLGMSPNRLFMPDFYAEQAGLEADVDPFKHYLIEKGYRKYSPHPAIDLDFYESQAPDFDRDRIDVISDFLGRPLGTRPFTHPFFDLAHYNTVNPDIQRSGLCPITHFLEYGIHEGRVPNAIFSYQYAVERPDPAKVHVKNGVLRQFLTMANKPMRLIFVSHDATRTGAPAIILRLMEDFSRYTNVECICILTRGGERAPEFWLAAHTVIFNKGAWEVGHLGELARHDVQKLLSLFADNMPVAAFVNSAESRYVGHLLKDAGIPVISLVHELADFYDPSEFEWIYKFSDKVVFPSHFVELRAQAAVGVVEDKTVVRGQGLLRDGFGQRDRTRMREQVLKEFGLPSETRLVLGCGTIDQRKGVDYFVNIAKRAISRQAVGDAPLVFFWIGDGHRNSTSPWYMAQIEIKAAGLERQIRFIGGRDDVEPYFVAADMFLMTSRGDPYPCVIHEAMASGLPTIAFEGGGGAPELITDSGVIVPLGDIEAAVDAVLKLASDEPYRAGLADRAREIIRERGSSYDYFQFFVDLVVELAGVARDSFGEWRGYRPGSKPPIFFLQADWSVSGVNTFTDTLARHLIAKGYPVELLFCFGMDHLIYIKDKLPAGIPIRFLKPGEHSLASLWFRMREFFKNVGPCIVFPNFDYRASAVTPTFSERIGVIGIAHSDHIEHYEHMFRLGRYWNKVVGVSQQIGVGIEDVNPALADRLGVIPYGVDWVEGDFQRLATAKQTGDDVIRLVYAGRFVVEQKNIFEYVKLADELHARGVPFELHMCGDGAELEPFRLRAASHIKAGRVVAPGRLDKDEMAVVYDKAHALVLLSDYEGLPLSMLEGMAHGCVPVCYDIESGLNEVVKDGVNGRIVPPRDPKAAADAIEALWKNADDLARMSQSAYETIGTQGLRNDDMGEKYRALVDEVYEQIADLSFDRPRSLNAETPYRGVIPSPYFS
jgi:glycosyltransferase involved in cell wall biosynthesis